MHAAANRWRYNSTLILYCLWLHQCFHSFLFFLEISAQFSGGRLLFLNCVCVAVKRNARTKDAEDLFRTITTEGKNQPWVVCAFGGEWWWLGDDSDVNKSGKVSKILDS